GRGQIARREVEIERADPAAAAAVGVVRSGNQPAVGDVQDRRRHAAAGGRNTGAAVHGSDGRIRRGAGQVDAVDLAVRARRIDLVVPEDGRLDLGGAAE